jgi:hypothetical protein
MDRLQEILAKFGSVTTSEFDPKAWEQFKVDDWNNTVGNRNEEDGYNCPICKNKGTIAKLMDFGNGTYSHCFTDCKCVETRNSIMRMKRSGLKDIIKDYTFDRFVASEPWQKAIKEAAMDYAKNPEGWFFIGGQSGCVDADTEYFNGSQWKRIAEYDGGCVLQYDPTVEAATLTRPKRYIAAPSEKLYKISTIRGSVDQVLSADHNFAYITTKGHMQKKPFREVMRMHKENVQGFYGKVETTFSYGGNGIDLSDNEIRLMCAVMADGSFRKNLQLCTINVKKERKKERMRELLSGVDYKEYRKSNGYSTFRFYAPRREKTFTEYWYACNNHQLQIVAEEVFYWDGRIDSKNRHHFFSTDKASADFVQFALSATGRRATIGVDNRKNKPCYVVIASTGNSTVSMASTGGKNKAEITEVIPKDGKQYCFEVETGYLVLRRNGRIFITGNSGKTHLCTAICREFLLSGKKVIYMLWRDEVVRLKAIVNDADEYRELIDKYKTADVLYIDDMFKTGKAPDGSNLKITGGDVNVAFEIINYRYNNPSLLTIISSELSEDDLLEIDEATGGRIYERAKAFTIGKSRDRNYRIKKAVTL